MARREHLLATLYRPVKRGTVLRSPDPAIARDKTTPSDEPAVLLAHLDLAQAAPYLEIAKKAPTYQSQHPCR
jgi:hypothetical protein